jgi:hypothetical protein
MIVPDVPVPGRCELEVRAPLSFRRDSCDLHHLCKESRSGRPDHVDLSRAPKGSAMSRRVTAAVLVAGALALGGAACSDDDESSSETEVCSAFSQVIRAVDDIQDVEVHDEGAEALLVSVEQLGSTLAQLGREVSDALQPAVEQLQDDLGTVEDTLNDIGDQPTDAQLDQVEDEIETAVASARAAVSAAGDDLPDCNLTLD